MIHHVRAAPTAGFVLFWLDAAFLLLGWRLVKLTVGDAAP